MFSSIQYWENRPTDEVGLAVSATPEPSVFSEDQA